MRMVAMSLRVDPGWVPASTPLPSAADGVVRLADGFTGDSEWCEYIAPHIDGLVAKYGSRG